MLTPQVPFPPRQGTALRNWGLLRGLAEHHRLSLLSFAGPDQPLEIPDEIWERVDHAVVAPHPERALPTRLRQLLISPYPDLAWRLMSDVFEAHLVDFLARERFDWLLVEGLELTLFLQPLWGRGDTPRVAFDDHNCEYLLQKRAFTTDVHFPRRWAGAAYSYIQWRRLRRYEAQVCRRAALVVAVSQADAAALREIAPDVAPLVIPNGITIAEYAGVTEQAPMAQPAFVFTGTMDFRPNVDGALWFVEQVWPRVRAALPDAHFYVVGRRPHARLDPLREVPGVVITGGVPDTRPFINAASVYVVPLWVGGGTRFKILEAGAMGKAMVSTSLGAEGFPDVGRAVILADDAETFAAHCVRLARDATARQELGKRAAAFAANYDWAALAPRLS
ncbi:MAG: glycosyltransferase, partial [Anaerolineae bacterium]|nr:glycosyltransferase [Anaerolineae bacterium]